MNHRITMTCGAYTQQKPGMCSRYRTVRTLAREGCLSFLGGDTAHASYGVCKYEVHICTYNTSTLLAPRELLHLESTESERACECEPSCDFDLSVLLPVLAPSVSLLLYLCLSLHTCV